ILVAQIIFDDAANATGDLFSLCKVIWADKTKRNKGIVVNQGVAALIVLKGNLHQIVEPSLGVAYVLLVTAYKTAPRTGTANKLKPTRSADILTQRFGTTHFHGALLYIGMHEVSGNVSGVQTLEEIVGHR